jgi:hypothetical protein
MMLTSLACTLLIAGGPVFQPGIERLPGRAGAPATIAPHADTTAVAAPADTAAAPPQPPDAKEPPTPPHTGIRALTSGVVSDVRHLPSLPNLYLAVIGGGLAAGVHPVDGTVNIKLRGHQNVAQPIFGPGKYVGQTAVQVGAALTVYIVGRTRHADKASHLGMDLLRAQIVTSAVTTALKYSTRRERPDGSNQHSFPSGHASITFATATVLERHLGWRSSVLGYTVASYVAASRLHDNRHYLSDVVFGAAVGAIGGRTVTEHGRNVWTFAPVPVPGGMALMASRTGTS